MPFTRNCLKHKKVRHEIGEQGEAKSAELKDLQDQYDHLVSLARRRGFNAAVFVLAYFFAVVGMEISCIVGERERKM